MTESEPVVAVLPSGTKLGCRPGKLPVDHLMWPLGMPRRLNGKRLADLLPSDHLIIYPQTTSYIRPNFGTSARVSVLVLEPEICHTRHIKRLKMFYWRFFRVLTAVERLCNTIPNGVFFPFGSTWVPDWQVIDTSKSRMVSLISSGKRSLPGHLLRHEIAEWAVLEKIDIDVIGRGYKPFEEKWEGLAPYRFSIVIENSIEPNYFTEKLIDSILCETVPIYLGCPNIDKFLDIGGMIVCQNTDDIRQAVLHASTKLYAQKIPHLREIKN